MLIQDNYKKIKLYQDTIKHSELEHVKSGWVVLLVYLVFLVVLVYMVNFQFTQAPKWKAHGNNMYSHTIPIIAERGRIVDRNGIILAMNESMSNIIVDPYQLPKFDVETMKLQNNPQLSRAEEFYQNLDQLAVLLDQPKVKIYDAFDYKTYEGKHKGDYYLKRDVDKDIANMIKALNIPGLKITTGSKRRYVDGNLFGQMIGVTKVDVDNNQYERIVGLEGLEYQFDQYLQGQNGLRTIAQNNRGRYIDTMQPEKNTPAIHGQDLVLSVDKNIQLAAMEALQQTIDFHQAVSGSVVVLDAKTGEILAIVNYPNFNPDKFTEYNYKTRRNYAVNDLIEPGSLLKPLIVAKALDDGKITDGTLFDTNPYTVGKYEIKDDVYHSQLTVTDIIKKSSNVGVSKIIRMLDSKDVFDYLTSLGVGQKPNSSFPGEASGVLRHWNMWYPIDKVAISYGYGVHMSLLQLAKSYTIFTNGGKLLTPTFIKLQGKKHEEKQVIDTKTASKMRTIMAMVTQPGGSGHRAAIDGFQVAGKTGTVRKLVNGSYSTNSHVALFVGYAPADDPRLIVAVSIDNPRKNSYYGGQVAAPLFAKIMSTALNILGVAPSQQISSNILAN